MFIFLDIDGVLNTDRDWQRGGVIRDECVKVLADIAKKCNQPKIILSSSWRKGYISQQNKNNSPQIRELEEMFAKYNLRITGTLPHDNLSRDVLISNFLEKYKGDYLVVDDDVNEFVKRPDRLLLTDCKTGLKKADVKRAIRLL